MTARRNFPHLSVVLLHNTLLLWHKKLDVQVVMVHGSDKVQMYVNGAVHPVDNPTLTIRDFCNLPTRDARAQLDEWTKVSDHKL